LPKSVPYVIEIDKLGEARYRGELANLSDNFKLSDLQLVFHLKRFVSALRAVSSDNRVNEARLQEAWSMVDLTGGNMVRAYIEGGGNPYKRAETEIVTIDVTGAVQISKDTWQVEWRERAWDRQGNSTRNEVWRGMFRTIQRPPGKTNPSGLYVHELHWDRVST
jgi:type IV secretion system protein VirB5